MLDKNPDEVLDDKFKQIRDVFSKNVINSLMFEDPFVKTVFLREFIQRIECQVFYFDFDLMYSGYVASDVIDTKQNVHVMMVEKENFNELMMEVIEKITVDNSLIIIDSLNGFLAMFNEQSSGRYVESSIRLLSLLCRQKNTMILVTSLGRERDGEVILSPVGRQLLESRDLRSFVLRTRNSELYLSETNKTKNRDIISLRL